MMRYQVEYVLYVICVIWCVFQRSSCQQQQIELEVDEVQRGSREKLLLCFYTGWSRHRLQPRRISPNLCTHIVFAIARVHNNGTVSRNEQRDIALYRQINNMKRRNSSLKTLLSVGGPSLTWAFEEIMPDVSKRRIFVSSVVNLLRTHSFDGMDMNWEFPTESNKHIFTIVLRELREAFEANSRLTGKERLQLVATIGGKRDQLTTVYDFPAISFQVDYMLMMAYDLYGGWSSTTGLHSALYGRQGESDNTLNQHWIIQECIRRGAHAAKLLLGVPAYGRTFHLSSTDNHDVGAPVIGVGADNRLGERGYMDYGEICLKLRSGWTAVMHTEHKTPYAYSGNQWVGYENPSSLTTKTQYVLDNGLGGLYVWEMSLDDHRGECRGGRFPLLQAIRRRLSTVTSNLIPGSTQTPGMNEPDTSTQTTTPSGTAVSCRNRHGAYLSHPTDCTKFYRCSHGTAHEFTCPTGLYWHPHPVNTCDWPRNVRCQRG